MDIFLNNFNFIWFNSFLALIAIPFGWLMVRARSKLIKIISGFLWLIFLPNTIYILTDVSHLFEDLPKVDNLFRIILIFQYSLFAIFGIITFAASTYFFQRLLEGKRKNGIKPTTILAICALNFIVGFGVVLGGIRRTNSWYVFTDPLRVFEDVLSMIYSQELLILSFGIGLLANLIYFTTAETVATWGKKYLKR